MSSSTSRSLQRSIDSVRAESTRGRACEHKHNRMGDASNIAEAPDSDASDPLLEQAEEGTKLEGGPDHPAASNCCDMKALWNEIK